MRWVGLFIITLFFCLVATAANLTPCPDCEQQVSPRAVLCPHCGCPGQAIKDAVAEREAATRPLPVYPVASFKAGSAEGVAVGYTDGIDNYLLLDAYPLMGAASLEIMPLTTDAPIAYHTMQVAAQTPLVRFRTPATNLTFLSRARLRTGRVEAPGWLLADGSVASGASTIDMPLNGVALVDGQTNLISVVGRGPDENPMHIPFRTTWIDIAPGRFRKQTASLLAAYQAAVQKKLTPEIIGQLKNTKWATPFFERTAEEIIKLSEQEDSNAAP